MTFTRLTTGTNVEVNNLKVTRIDPEADTSFEVEEGISGKFWIEDTLLPDATMHVYEPLVFLAQDNDPYIYEVTERELWRHIDPEGAKQDDITECEYAIAELENWLAETHDGNKREQIQEQIDNEKDRLAKLKG